MKVAVRFGGAGGQGIVLAGLILAEAAARAGRRVACTQAYGPESRGGASRSDVIISDGPILFPVARRLDVLVALTQQACEASWQAVAPHGVAVLDAGIVPPAEEVTYHLLPLQDTARRITRSTLGANMVALGVVASLVDLVPPEALEEAVASRVPTASRSLNLAALEAGRALGRSLRQETSPVPGGGP